MEKSTGCQFAGGETTATSNDDVPDAKESLWRNRRFYDALDWAAETFGDAEALVCRDTRLGFGAVREKVREFARALLALGISKGDHVALWMSDCPDWYVARWAVPSIGAVLIPVNTRFRAHDLGYVLKQSDAKALIVGTGGGGVDYLAILKQIAPSLFGEPETGGESDLPLLQTVLAFGNEAFPLPEHLPPRILSGGRLAEFAAAADEAALDAAIARVAPQDVVQIMYTSGTTSFPKGAMLCHGPLLQNNFNTIVRMNLTPRDRFLMSVPLFSATGTSYTLLILLAGAALVLMGERFDPKGFCELIEKERITASFFVDAIVKDLQAFEERARYDLSSLRTGTGLPMSADSFAFLTHEIGIPELIGVFGMSETSNAVTRCFFDDPYELRASTQGRPVPGVSVRIVDVETGQALAAGKIGELCVKGYTVMRGYYKRSDEDERAFDAEGWFHSGDLGRLTAEGCLVFCGRVKEMIKPGGFNVSTLEIESFLKRYDGVREAAVVGVPDARLGEVAYAYIEPEPGVLLDSEKLIEFCRVQIAAYKVPRHVEFVRDWPRTGSQKIRKLELKAQARARLGFAGEKA
jgi:fatty-acyl-CoA synthase